MPASFLAATTPEPLGPGRFGLTFDASWYQARGAYGGVVAGAVLRAMERTVGDATRPVRSLTAHFCAPAEAGPAELQVRVERTGKLVSHVTARVEAASGVLCVASATFGAARPGGLAYCAAVMPEAPPPEGVPPLAPDAPVPTFLQHFDVRFCLGAPPYAGAPEALVGGWLRPHVPELLDAPLAVGLLDAYPPAVLSRAEDFRPAATVDLTFHFFHPLPRPGAEAQAFYLRTGRSRWAGDGYAEDLQDLWDADGTLLVQCRQLQAVLG